MKYRAALLSIVLLIWSNISSATESFTEVREFFNKITNLSNSYDVSVVKYYSDDAKIGTIRTYPTGMKRSLELTGKQWKELIIKAMPLAKLKNDKSTMSNIEVIKKENGYKISAHRYSHLRCYTDKQYYMVIIPDINNSFVIVEEFMATQPNSDC